MNSESMDSDDIGNELGDGDLEGGGEFGDSDFDAFDDCGFSEEDFERFAAEKNIEDDDAINADLDLLDGVVIDYPEGSVCTLAGPAIYFDRSNPNRLFIGSHDDERIVVIEAKDGVLFPMIEYRSKYHVSEPMSIFGSDWDVTSTKRWLDGLMHYVKKADSSFIVRLSEYGFGEFGIVVINEAPASNDQYSYLENMTDAEIDALIEEGKFPF